MCQCDVRSAVLGCFPVAAACWCAGIEDLPFPLGCPVMDELANPVRVITRNIPGGVVAINIPQDHPFILYRKAIQREAVDSLVRHRRPDGRALDIVDVEVSRCRGLCATFSRCVQDDSNVASHGGVVLWLEGGLPDGLEVKTVLDEDGDVPSPNRSLTPLAASPT